MKRKAFILALLILISGTSASAQAVVRKCAYLHIKLQAHDAAIYELFQNSGPVNTTSIRSEMKFVNRTVEVESFVKQLEKQGYKRRDVVAPGTVNITRTDYMPVGDFHLDGMKLAVKVRFRKYLTKDAQEEDNQNAKPIPKMVDRSKFEFKVDHPNFKGEAVIKPTIDILDSDIKYITSRKLFWANQKEVQKRLNEINPGSEALVGKFLNAMAERYRSEQAYKQGLFARTEYERAAFSLPLKSQLHPDLVMDAQITLDQKVFLIRLSDGKVFRPYKESETVVENKTPIALARMSEQDVQDTPSLETVKKFVQFADEHHVDGYEKGAGKMSKMEKKAIKKLRNAQELEQELVRNPQNDLQEQALDQFDYE